jgi:hypothetical protein
VISPLPLAEIGDAGKTFAGAGGVQAPASDDGIVRAAEHPFEIAVDLHEAEVRLGISLMST